VSESKEKDRVNICCHAQDQARFSGEDAAERIAYRPEIQPTAVRVI
jgi:hypothetical protein